MADAPSSGINPFAIVAIVCGGLSLLCACICYGFPFNLLGIVFGAVAIAQTGAGSTQGGRGLAIAGVALSVLSVLIVVGLVVLGMGAGMLSAVLDNM
jgi:hypothetical protein